MSIFNKPLGHFLDDSHLRVDNIEPAIKAMHIYLMLITDSISDKGTLNRADLKKAIERNIWALKQDNDPEKFQDKITEHLQIYLKMLG